MSDSMYDRAHEIRRLAGESRELRVALEKQEARVLLGLMGVAGGIVVSCLGFYAQVALIPGAIIGLAGLLIAYVALRRMERLTNQLGDCTDILEQLSVPEKSETEERIV